MDPTTNAPEAAPAPAPDAPPADTGEVSLIGIMQRAEAEAAKQPEKPQLDDTAEDADAPDEPEGDAKPPDAPEDNAAPEKADEPKPLDIGAVKAHVAEVERHAEKLTGELAEAHRGIAQYEAALEILQADNARLIAFLKDQKLVDDRDLRLRQLEIEAAARAKMEEADKVYASKLEEAKQQAAFDAQVRHYEREIPKALKQYELVSEAELCAAIERLPPGADENIPALAKSLHDAKLVAAKRQLNAERRARRALPSAPGGTTPPPDFTLDKAGFADLMQRQRPGR